MPNEKCNSQALHKYLIICLRFEKICLFSASFFPSRRQTLCLINSNLFRLFSIGFLVELKAEQELPVVFSRDPFAFLDKASKGTKDEYIRLYKDRETPRNELQKKRDELIAKESEEIQVSF